MIVTDLTTVSEFENYSNTHKFYNFRQFVFAREFRGYSQTDLSKAIEGLQQSNLSKFEKGVDILSDQLIDKIITYLDFPKEFFYKKINNFPENAHYRKRSTISKKEKNSIEYKIRLLSNLIDEMSETIEWLDFKLKPFDLEEGYTPEYVASYTRKILGIGPQDNVMRIFNFIEASGIIVMEIDVSEKFDGVSLITDKGHHVIFINKNFTNDRKRFTLAHELGHILMHISGNFPIPFYRDEKQREIEANRFASEFLMPESTIKKSLFDLKLSYLKPLKLQWLTSMQSIIRRAYDLKCIDKEKYTYLNIELSRAGQKKNEGIPVFIDSPIIFDKAFNMFKNDLNYSTDEMTRAFAIPKDVILDIFYYKLNNFQNSNLKISI